jgi:hypothetical protein
MAVTLGSSGITLSSGTQTSVAPDLGGVVSITTYTSGTNTYTVPAGATKVYVQLVGGGGGSAGYCESGGAGGYAEGVYSIAAGTAVTATVGGGGGGVGYYTGAGNGGTTSFGSYCSATGGYGANQNATHTGGHSGVGSGGQVNLTGGGGTGHSNHGSHNQYGAGGASYFGGGPAITRHQPGVANNFGGGPGAGAAGNETDDGSLGSTGKAGVIIIYALK